MKRINPQQLPNLTQDTNMKRLNYVKLASSSPSSASEACDDDDPLVGALADWPRSPDGEAFEAALLNTTATATTTTTTTTVHRRTPPQGCPKIGKRLTPI